MTNEIFADGIGAIRAMGETIRIDFVSVGQPHDGKAPAIIRQRVIMTPAGFVAAHAAMQRMIDQLRERNLLPKQKPTRPL